jgi:2-oxoglutarate dehydrogenase complex dehydrogenase (E1) component-like enzyme
MDSIESLSNYPTLIHGDAAFAGQAVAEDAALADQGLPGRRHDHLIINNQPGFFHPGRPACGR